MNVEIQINNSIQPAARFVTWAPSPCRIRITNPSGFVTPIVQVTLSQTALAGGGSIVFATTPTGAGTPTITLPVPLAGGSVTFFVRGITASNANPGVSIRATARPMPLLPVQNVGNVPIMVRVRKSANALSAGERDRFVAAMAQLNNQGLGRFTDFRDMHRSGAPDLEAHGAPGFLSWHRAYILDLERELQALDASVTLPYWRFDQAAPNIFQLNFLGVSNAAGVVSFAPTNPLQFWRTDSQTGITRVVPFNINNPPPGLRTQAQTLALGNPGALFANFRAMEGNPHGSAHVSFTGASFIRSIGTAARDPLFFLLHCNVDRLWAVWQRANNRYDFNTPQSFDTNNPGNKAGHNLNDTMWPWNGITGGGRPATAPGGALASSPCVSAPGPQPRVRHCLDFMGKINPAANLGFCYDDVAF